MVRLTSGYAADAYADPASREPYFTLAVPDISFVRERLDQAEIPNSGLVREPVDGIEALFVDAPSIRLLAVVQA